MRLRARQGHIEINRNEACLVGERVHCRRVHFTLNASSAAIARAHALMRGPRRAVSSTRSSQKGPHESTFAATSNRPSATFISPPRRLGFLPPPLHASDPDQHQATVAATARAHTMGMDMVAPRGSRSLPAGGARQRRRGRQGRSSIVGASPAATPRRRRPSCPGFRVCFVLPAY